MIIGTAKLFSTPEPMFICSCDKCKAIFHIGQKDKRVIEEKTFECPNCREQTK